MRRVIVLLLGCGIWLAPRPAPAIVLPTCSFPDPSFGVMLDQDKADEALANVYVDGVVAVPVSLGLGMAKFGLQDLASQGLIVMDVLTEAGKPLGGSVELAASGGPATANGGRPGWAIWVGAGPFEPHATYRLQYSFVNDKVSDCPEAIPVRGELGFTTGELSAAELLASPTITGVTFQYAAVNEPGCCSVPELDACVQEGKCTACWLSYQRTTGASVAVQSDLPSDYFRVDVLLRGDAEPLQQSEAVLGTAQLSVEAPAAEYCFEAQARLRAPTGKPQAVEHCERAGTPPPGLLVDARLVALPGSACSDGPLQGKGEEQFLLYARLGADEAEATAALAAPLAPPGTPAGTMPPAKPGVTTSHYGGGCTLVSGSCRARYLDWAWALLGSLALIRRRRPERGNPARLPQPASRSEPL